MSMSKKDYVAIAERLKSVEPGFVSLHEGGAMTERKHGWRLAVHAVADACQRDNPRFDRQRFLSACGVS